MSNQSIIEKIKAQLSELESGTVSTKMFVDFLDANTEALENIPYTEIQRSRDFQHRVEVAGFTDEEDCISDLSTVINEIRKWIEQLK